MIKSDCYISCKFCFRISNLIQKPTMLIRYKLYVVTHPILNLYYIYISECHTILTLWILRKVSIRILRKVSIRILIQFLNISQSPKIPLYPNSFHLVV